MKREGVILSVIICLFYIATIAFTIHLTKLREENVKLRSENNKLKQEIIDYK